MVKQEQDFDFRIEYPKRIDGLASSLTCWPKPVWSLC